MKKTRASPGSSADALQEAHEELHAAAVCYSAAQRTNYLKGRRHVAAALRRLEHAADAYYTILMAIRGTPVCPLGEEQTPKLGATQKWARKQRRPK